MKSARENVFVGRFSKTFGESSKTSTGANRARSLFVDPTVNNVIVMIDWPHPDKTLVCRNEIAADHN